MKDDFIIEIIRDYSCVCFTEIISRQKVHLGHEKSVRLMTVRFIIVRFIEIFS